MKKWNGQCPPIVPTPVYDGDGVRPSDGIAVWAGVQRALGLYRQRKRRLPSRRSWTRWATRSLTIPKYIPGIYGRVNVSFFPYAFGGKKGIGMWPGPSAETGRRGASGRFCANSGAGVWCTTAGPGGTAGIPAGGTADIPTAGTAGHLHGRRLQWTRSPGCRIDDSEGLLAPLPF